IGDPAVEAQPRHRTVHGPGVEVLVAQPARHLLGGARLPHSGWSVNGYDAHAVPSFSMADSGICHDRKSTRLNSSHVSISYALCLRPHTPPPPPLHDALPIYR